MGINNLPLKKREAAAAVMVCFLFNIAGCLSHRQGVDPPSRNTPTVREIIPLTISNLKGHETLFKEGLFVISSSEKALKYAKENSIISSREAFQMVRERYRASSENFFQESKKSISDIPLNTKKGIRKGTSTTKKILRLTHSLVKKELHYGTRNFSRAWESLIRGNISIVKRSERERESLKNIPMRYYRSIKEDLSNVNQVSSALLTDYKQGIRSSWDGALDTAVSEFNKGYMESGERRNSLSALGPLLIGYGKSLYSVFSPVGKSGVHLGKRAVNAGYLAVSGAVIVSGRTFQSLGLTFFHVGKMGYHLVSPTLKSGVLTALASLAYGTVPITYAAGGGVGAINQVAFTGGAPLYSAGRGSVSAALSTGKYSGLLIYDGVRGSSKIAINQVKSGVVLGYNAITALPAHLFMAVPDTAIFLAWDGPRLIIAVVKGEIISDADDSSHRTYTPGDLPVGSVVNLDQLEKRRGVELEVLTDAPEIIEKVLEELPHDLRN